MKHPLYLWQEQCLREWRKNRHHGIVNVITGAGKTYLALAAANELIEQTGTDRLRIKIVVPTASLLTQWAFAIRSFFGGFISRSDIGLYYSGRRDPSNRLFTIYVINSARYSAARHILKDIGDGFTVFLIADECHRYTGSENRKIFDFLPFTAVCPGQYASLGLSATPGLERSENAAVLIPALGKEIFRYGLKEAEEEGTLCPYAAFHIALSFTMDEQIEYEELSDLITRLFSTLIAKNPVLKKLRGSRFFITVCQIVKEGGENASLARMYLYHLYRRKHLTSDAASRIPCVLRLISLLDTGARIIVFGERITQADALYVQLDRLYPHQAARFHSAMDPDARKLALTRFCSGEVRILISCRALDEGFDVPAADVGIVMSSTSVNRQRIQRLGRILRRYEGKEIASLYYLHVTKSSEEPSYIPVEDQTAAVCELSYDLDYNEFSHPAYEKRARAAMRTFHRRSPESELLAEAKSCLALGIIRPDWLLGKVYCGKRIKAAKTKAERNYWICMKQIAGDE